MRRDEGAAQLTKTLADIPVTIPVSRFGRTRPDILPLAPFPPVHEDLDVRRRFLCSKVHPEKLH